MRQQKPEDKSLHHPEVEMRRHQDYGFKEHSYKLQLNKGLAARASLPCDLFANQASKSRLQFFNIQGDMIIDLELKRVKAPKDNRQKVCVLAR
jgi:hypothetical protein